MSISCSRKWTFSTGSESTTSGSFRLEAKAISYMNSSADSLVLCKLLANWSPRSFDSELAAKGCLGSRECLMLSPWLLLDVTEQLPAYLCAGDAAVSYTGPRRLQEVQQACGDGHQAHEPAQVCLLCDSAVYTVNALIWFEIMSLWVPMRD